MQINVSYTVFPITPSSKQPASFPHLTGTNTASAPYTQSART